MNNDKAWYEKVGIWIGIVAGICTIIAFIFSLLTIPNTLSNNSEMGDDSSKIDNSFNGDGNNNIIIQGDNNGDININTDTTSESSISSETDDFSVIASYDMNTIQSSFEGIDVLIKAETTFPAEHVTISGVSDNAELETTDMHGGESEWYFKANFYIKGTYTITVTAYSSNGESVSDVFTYTY